MTEVILVPTSRDIKTGAVMQFITGDSAMANWDKIEKLLEQVPETWMAEYSKEDIYKGLCSGYVHAWQIGTPEGIRVVIFSQFVQFPKVKYLEVFWAAGTNFLESCADLVDSTLENFAARMGADQIRVVGRNGWYRKLRTRGYEQVGVVMAKSVKTTGHLS